MQKIDLMIVNAGQLCTMPTQDGQPQRGAVLGNLGMIRNGAVAIHEGGVVAVGANDTLTGDYSATTVIDAGGKLVTPGLVDAHTHAVWAGERAAEFERRIAGASYQEIMAQGGGINYTVRHTRQADLEMLIHETEARLRRMLQHGTTTVEIKSGYGLETATELKMLEASRHLSQKLPLDIVPTFLGAHAIPPEYADKPDAYVDLVIREMLPAVIEWKNYHKIETLYCDVFCENGAFSLAQSRQILEAAQGGGLGLKIHADEFGALGGTALAVELGAVSADHLVVTPLEEIEALGKSSTMAVSMPPTPFGLGHHHFTPARAILEAGGALVIATDCNPGTAWCENMQLVLALAARYLRLTPAQALACATVNAAFAIGKGGQMGTLAAGALADVVIWQVEDYRTLAYRFGTNMVQQVIKRGQSVFSQD